MLSLHRLAAPLLAPVLIAQGKQVRRGTVTLPEPPGPRRGQAGDGPPLRLLILGDSSAAGVGAPAMSAALIGQLVGKLTSHFTVQWTLAAKTGTTTQSTLQRMSQHPLPSTDVAITVLGVNDVTSPVRLKD